MKASHVAIKKKSVTLARLLKLAGSCGEESAWVGNRSIAAAYRECERGDWMLWLCAKIGVDRKLVVRAACKCARLSLSRVPAGGDRPRIAIETAEAWTEGRATIEQVRSAANAAAYAANATANAAATATAAAAAAYAANATANAAAAVYAATATAAYAAAAYAAANAAAAAYADADAAKANTLAKCADLVRETISLPVIREAIRDYLKTVARRTGIV